MKNLKIIVFTVIPFLISNQSYSQEKTAHTVLIRTFEVFGGKQSKMVVITPEGETKTIELKEISPKDYSIGSGENNIEVQSEINHWKNQDFVLDGVSNTSVASVLITTYVLSKEN